MKTRIIWSCFSIFMTVASLAQGEMPLVGVQVSDARGAVAYRGQTNASGTFATGKLVSGEYAVQFNSERMPQGNYTLVLSAGQRKVLAEAVAGSRFGQGGV